MLYRLKPSYYNLIAADRESLKNMERVYFVVSNLKYKGQKVSVGVPLRANINKAFQKDYSAYITTRPTAHTMSGNIGGWHFTKLIPVDGLFLNPETNNWPNHILAESVAQTFIGDFKDMAQAMLDRFESGERVFGAIDFDSALKSLNFLKMREAEIAAQKRNAEQNAKALPLVDESTEME